MTQPGETMKRIGIFVTLLLAGTSLSAQDYSRAALFEIFVKPPAPLEDGFSAKGAEIRYKAGNSVIRFVPLMMPIAGTEPGTSPMPVVDPFALTGTVLPDTKGTISRLGSSVRYEELSLRDRFELWRTRRELSAILKTMR